MKKIIAVLAFGLMLSGNASAESYLCIGEAAGGVKFDEITGKPFGTSFKATDKYIIKKTWDVWAVNEFGDQSPVSYKCEVSENVIDCKMIGGNFIISTNKLRYMKYTFFGWSGAHVIEGKKYKGTPNIEVGSCSEI